MAFTGSSEPKHWMDPMNALFFVAVICYPGNYCAPVSPQKFSSAESCQEYLPVLAENNERFFATQVRPGGGTYKCVAKSSTAKQAPAPAPKSFTVTMCISESACDAVNTKIVFGSYRDCMRAMVDRLGPGVVQNDRRLYIPDDGKGYPYVWYQCDPTPPAQPSS
jgi:hypothetical protein